MATLRKKILSFGAVSAVLATSLIVTSCNIKTTREQKDLKLDDKVFESKDFKELKGILQKEFQKSITNSLYVDYYKYNLNNSPSFSAVAKASTNEELKRALIEEKNGIGNFGTDIIYNILYNTRWNKAVPLKYRILLNKISTMYNRTINTYPVKIYKTTKDGGKVVHIDFRTDLQTTMKHRFMRKFIDLSADIPVENDSKGNPVYTFDRYKKFFNIDATSVDSIVKTIGNDSYKMDEVLKSTIFNANGIGVDKQDLISDKKLLTNTTPSLMQGIFPQNTAKTGIYEPKFTGKIEAIPSNFEYEFAFKNGAKQEKLAVFTKDQKVSELMVQIKDKLFVNSKQELIKKLFGKNGAWNIDVVARTWAGNDASHYSISDWVENIGHRSNIFYYISNKKDPTQYVWYKTTTSMGGV